MQILLTINRATATFFILLFGLVSGCNSATEHLVSSQDAYHAAIKKIQPGDSIVLANGTWQDFEILFAGKGTAKKPITLRAQTPGKVIISGESNLRLAGEYLVVRDLVFKDGYTPTSSVIAFRKGKGEYANHSRAVSYTHLTLPTIYSV